MTLSAPRDKPRAKSRITWIRNQLTKARLGEIFIRASWPGRAPATQASLEQIKEDQSCLEADNKSLAPLSFEVCLIRDLAGKFAGSRTFIEHIEEAVPYFYEQVGQYLRAYVAPPPRLRGEETRDEAEDLLEGVADEASATASDAVDQTQSTTHDDTRG